MASADHSDDENLPKSGNNAYGSDDSFSDGNSDTSDDSDNDGNFNGKEPCKYYNSGGCKDGGKCSYLHVCRFALTGNCRKGSSCKLNHSRGRESSGPRSRAPDRSTSSDPKLTDGRFYQWQLNDGKHGWTDVDNDHILEAQYSLPHTKTITIYNTPYGAVSIDFNRMRVTGKSLRVRRLDDGNTEWSWYCTLGRKWIKYGDKDPNGNPSPVKSSDIEKKFQSNPASSYTFTRGAETFEIRFREMQQVTSKRKRKVTRRSVYRQPAGAGVSQTTSTLQNMSFNKPQWQFEGDSGTWHEFKRRSGTSTECSVTSDDIERKYKQNPNASMTFKVHGHAYVLDFGAMTQTNLKTKRSRKIRRVLV